MAAGGSFTCPVQITSLKSYSRRPPEFLRGCDGWSDGVFGSRDSQAEQTMHLGLAGHIFGLPSLDMDRPFLELGRKSPINVSHDNSSCAVRKCSRDPVLQCSVVSSLAVFLCPSVSIPGASANELCWLYIAPRSGLRAGYCTRGCRVRKQAGEVGPPGVELW